MALTYLDPKTIGDALSCAWKKQLGTSQDPANGKWYTKGANGDDIGLYGGLTDAVPTSVVLDTAKATYDPQPFVADTANVNNLNGLNPSSSAALNYNYTTSQAITQSTTESVTLGTSFTMKVNEEVAEESATFSISGTFSSTQAETDTESDTITFSITVPVEVPSGKVYQAQLTAEIQTVTIPFTAVIKVTGTTETWFENQVNGHYDYSTDAGTAFGWIKSDNCAGSDSSSYADAGNKVGTITITGTIRSSQTGSFQTQIVDITDQFVKS
jgi:hypothetical protein